MESQSNYDPESKLYFAVTMNSATTYPEIKCSRGADFKRVLWREKGGQKK